MGRQDFFQVFYVNDSRLPKMSEEEMKLLQEQVTACFTPLTKRKLDIIGYGSVVYSHCATDAHEKFGTLQGFAKMTVDLIEGKRPNLTYIDSGLRSGFNRNSNVYKLTNPDGVEKLIEKYGSGIVERPTGLMWYIK